MKLTWQGLTNMTNPWPPYPINPHTSPLTWPSPPQPLPLELNLWRPFIRLTRHLQCTSAKIYGLVWLYLPARLYIYMYMSCLSHRRSICHTGDRSPVWHCKWGVNLMKGLHNTVARHSVHTVATYSGYTVYTPYPHCSYSAHCSYTVTMWSIGYSGPTVCLQCTYNVLIYEVEIFKMLIGTVDTL